MLDNDATLMTPTKTSSEFSARNYDLEDRDSGDDDDLTMMIHAKYPSMLLLSECSIVCQMMLWFWSPSSAMMVLIDVTIYYCCCHNQYGQYHHCRSLLHR